MAALEEGSRKKLSTAQVRAPDSTSSSFWPCFVVSVICPSGFVLFLKKIKYR